VDRTPADPAGARRSSSNSAGVSSLRRRNRRPSTATRCRCGARARRCRRIAVVVHGGGSFGHHHAAEHGVSTAEGTRDAGSALAIHGAMVELNRVVVDALQDEGVPALPVHPLSAASRDGDGELSPRRHKSGHARRGVRPGPPRRRRRSRRRGRHRPLGGRTRRRTRSRTRGHPGRRLSDRARCIDGDDDAVVDRIGSFDEVADVPGRAKRRTSPAGWRARSARYWTWRSRPRFSVPTPWRPSSPAANHRGRRSTRGNSPNGRNIFDWR